MKPCVTKILTGKLTFPPPTLQKILQPLRCTMERIKGCFMPQCALSVLKSSAYMYMHSFSNLLELLYSSGTSLLGLHSVQSLRAAGLA